MMKFSLTAIYLFIIVSLTACNLPITLFPSKSASSIARPFPQHVVYAPGSILPNHRTQEQMDNDVKAFYDSWKGAFLAEAGTNSKGQALYRIRFGRNLPASNTTVSQGQGFGMIIMPMMAGYDPDAQAIFDGLWEFARAHPSEINSRLMDWNVPDTSSGNDSAFDGDADIAFALLLADAQWGSHGRINYRAEARTLINAILKSTIGPDSHLPMLGDWVNPNGKTYNQYTFRSSDLMPVNFRTFGKVAGNQVWNDVLIRSQIVMNLIQTNDSPQTGLMPEFIIIAGNPSTPQPAPANFLGEPRSNSYYYNAGRVPWRVGTDALLNNDAASRAIVQKISKWIETSAAGNPANIRSGYDLDGNPFPESNYFTTFFAAPMGVAAMTNSAQQSWLNAIYDSVYNRHEDSYEDSVTLLCLLVMAGNFWSP